MKKTTSSLLFLVLTLTAFSQLERKSWLGGGSLSYLNSKTSGSDAINNKVRALDIIPAIGYFVIKKGVVGIKSKITLTKATYPETNGTERSVRQNFFGFGPFIRYYFLPAENKINLFSEANYFHTIITNNSQSPLNNTSIGYDYSFLTGMVVFLNTSVGVEFIVGYTKSQQKNVDFKSDNLKFGIGLQFYLEKEK